MEPDEDTERLKSAFLIKCRKCGSENISFYFDEGTIYSENSADPPSVSIGCNDCQQNDLRF